MPEAFPSLSTVEGEANRRYSPQAEGEFIFDKLLAHLEGYNAEKIVSISEDTTRVISRVEYDSNNKIVGFVLPLDCNSLPDKTSFYATSFADIENIGFLILKRPLVHISTWCNPCQLLYHHFA